MQKVPPDARYISARTGKGEKTAAVKGSQISFQTDEKKFREGEEHPAGTAAPDRAVCLMRVDPAYFALRARAPLRQNPSASGGFLSRRAVKVFAIAGKNLDRWRRRSLRRRDDSAEGGDEGERKEIVSLSKPLSVAFGDTFLGGARAPKGRSRGVPAFFCHSERGTGWSGGIPSQGMGRKKRGDPSRLVSRFGMTYKTFGSVRDDMKKAATFLAAKFQPLSLPPLRVPSLTSLCKGGCRA